jgi:hypothetical protein
LLARLGMVVFVVICDEDLGACGKRGRGGEKTKKHVEKFVRRKVG